MAFIPVPNTAAVVIAYTYAQQRMINTYHVERQSPWDIVQLTLLAQNVRNWFVLNVLPLLSSDGVFLQTIATSLESASAPQFTITESPPPAGGTLIAVLPGGSCACITQRTALRGRSFRGRTYLSMLPQSSLAQGRFTGAFVAFLDSAFEQLRLDLIAAAWTWVVVSRQQGGVPLASGVTTPVTAVDVNQDPDSQRRRNPGRGV